MEEDGSTLLQRSCLDPCHVDSYAEDTDPIAIHVIVLLMPRHNFNLTCIRKLDVKGALLLLKQKNIPPQGVPLLPRCIST